MAVLECVVERILASLDELGERFKSSRDQIVVKTSILGVCRKELSRHNFRKRNVVDDPLELVKVAHAFLACSSSGYESAIVHHLRELKIIMFQCKRDRITLISIPTGLRLVL